MMKPQCSKYDIHPSCWTLNSNLHMYTMELNEVLLLLGLTKEVLLLLFLPLSLNMELAGCGDNAKPDEFPTFQKQKSSSWKDQKQTTKEERILTCSRRSYYCSSSSSTTAFFLCSVPLTLCVSLSSLHPLAYIHQSCSCATKATVVTTSSRCQVPNYPPLLTNEVGQ